MGIEKNMIREFHNTVKGVLTAPTNNGLGLGNMLRSHYDLPVLYMIKNEVVENREADWWLGQFGRAYIDRVIMTDDNMIFQESEIKGGNRAAIEALQSSPIWWETADESDVDEEAVVDLLPWMVAMIVEIMAPEY